MHKSLIIAALASYAVAKSSGHGKELQDGYNVEVTWDQRSQVVTFTVVMPNLTWLGLVLGSQTHDNSDMILFSANGMSSRFFDLFSEGDFAPFNDINQNLTGDFDLVGNEVKFSVSRKLDTGDPHDFLI